MHWTGRRQLDGVWSPDSHRIAFRSQRKGDYDAFIKDLATGGKDEPLLDTRERRQSARLDCPTARRSS